MGNGSKKDEPLPVLIPLRKYDLLTFGGIPFDPPDYRKNIQKQALFLQSQMSNMQSKKKELTKALSFQGHVQVLKLLGAAREELSSASELGSNVELPDADSSVIEAMDDLLKTEPSPSAEGANGGSKTSSAK